MKRVMLVLLVVIVATASYAEVVPSKLFADHMVIQRETEAPVWGRADAGEKITVTASWGASATTTADENGRWILKIETPTATAEPQTIEIKGAGAAITIKDVLVGDVWIASGQSNMQFGFNGSLNAQQEEKNFPQIRSIGIALKTSPGPLEDPPIARGWTPATPETVNGFSAVAFYFARRIHRETGLPIGILQNPWGGRRIEPFTPIEGFRLVPQLKAFNDALASIDPSTPLGKENYLAIVAATEKWVTEARTAIEAGGHPGAMPSLPKLPRNLGAPTSIYNAMVHPLVPYAIKGAIWYQGESNGSEGISYYHKMRALVGGWRAVWGQGDFPFYFVQLANFRGANGTPEGGGGYAKIREAQRKSLEIPKTGMAVAMDIGNERNIHPKDKQDVGARLAQWALARDYGKDIVPSGPLFKALKIDGNRAVLSFDYVGKGLMAAKKEGLDAPVPAAEGKLNCFAIAGADKVWHWGQAVIEGDTVVVTSKEVPEPVAVRFAYDASAPGFNFYNKDGLPASPFRTDDW